jgi:signal transduction histidine kinase
VKRCDLIPIEITPEGAWGRCYNMDMDRSFRPVHTGSDADLAFAVVVLASYFTTFSTLQKATTFELLLMIALGVAYIAVGIYGYALTGRINQVKYHLVYFAVQMTLGGLIVYLGKGVAYNAMVLLPLAGHSVVLLARHWRIGVNLLIVSVYVSALGLFSIDLSTMWSGLPLFLAGQIFIIVFTQMAVNEDRARSEVEKLASDLSIANKNLREFALQAEELAITKERNRLAREIHDGLGHYLTTVYMQIQAARAVMKSDPAKAQDVLNRAQNLTQEALQDVRSSVAALRESWNEGLLLSDEIEKVLKVCEGAGITGELKVIGSARPISPQARLAIFRAAQEGINNSCRHSHAQQLCVMLDYSRVDQVRLVVQDDGNGAGSVEGGFGLLGMRERVNLLDGKFQVVTSPGEGFKLEVQIPG